MVWSSGSDQVGGEVTEAREEFSKEVDGVWDEERTDSVVGLDADELQRRKIKDVSVSSEKSRQAIEDPDAKTNLSSREGGSLLLGHPWSVVHRPRDEA